MTSTQQTISDGLPEHLRSVYARSIKAMRDAPASRVLVMCGALYAVDEMQAGRSNPQHDGMRHKDWSARMLMNRAAATYPRLPVIISGEIKEWEGPYAPYRFGGQEGPVRHD